MGWVDVFFEKLGYVRAAHVNEQLNFARSVGKRLDEHRETVEAIQQKTSLFDDYWHVGHMATQDDYLMRLFHMVHGCWPESQSIEVMLGERVRPRPAVLGPCGLPEYSEGRGISNANAALASESLNDRL